MSDLNEEKSLNEAHNLGVILGDKIRNAVVCIFKNIKIIFKIGLFGIVMLILGMFGAFVWGKKAKR